MSQNQNLKIKINPLAIAQILQVFSYNRTQQQLQICGTLLGNSQIDVIEVTNSFYLPGFVFSEGLYDEEPEEYKQIVQPAVMEKHQVYLQNNKIVYPNESFIGCFVTESPTLQHDINIVLQSYRSKYAKFQNVSQLSQPFIMVIDPLMTRGHLNLKAYIVVEDLQKNIFLNFGEFLLQELPTEVAFNKETISDVTPFIGTPYGQERNFDQIDLSSVKNLAIQMKQNLETIRDVIKKIIAGKVPPNNKLGNQILNIISLMLPVNQKQVDEKTEKILTDKLLLKFLANLAQAQNKIGESLFFVDKKITKEELDE